MSLKVHRIEEAEIIDWAERHGLNVEVHERPRPPGDPQRYYAHFGYNVDIKDGACLVGSFGDGATPHEAVAAWARRVSLKRIVVDAFSETRREIVVPRLRATTEGKP